MMKPQRPIKYRGRLNRRGWKFMRSASLPGRVIMMLAGTGGVCILLEVGRMSARVRVCCNGVDYMMAAFRALGDAEEYAYGQLAGMVSDLKAAPLAA